MSEEKKHKPVECATTDHLCLPCDVETMARRLNLDSSRRVQQLAKDEGIFRKNVRGEYDCPYNVAAYIRMLHATKPTKRTNLAKKQEESLDIRNARERVEAVREWETMVLRKAIVKELATPVITLRNGIREIRSSLAKPIVDFVKEYSESVKNGEQVADYELLARVRKMLSGPLDEKLETFEREIKTWSAAEKEQG